MSADQPKRPLPTYDEALAVILAHAPALRDERVALAQAQGRTLRQSILADRDQPPFDRSAMDGFAVQSGQVGFGGSYPVVGTVAAGGAPASFQEAMPPGTVRRIATGAPLPAGADAVVPIEQAAVTVGGDGGERVGFSIEKLAPWQNVHRRASDATAGRVVVAAGTLVGPQHIGVAAAVGAVDLLVAQRPRITLITTGDELVPAETATAALQPQQVRNSNGPMLAAMLESLACPLAHHVHVPDDYEQTLAAAREAMSRSHLVVTVGGVSVGQRDFLPPAWKHLGLETLVHGVNIQPGKPVFAARDENKLVLGLPGNPVSVLAAAHLFLLPLLRTMLAADKKEMSPFIWRDAALAEPVKASAKRLVFRVGRLESDGRVRVIPWHGSGDLIHTAQADCLVRLPLTDEPAPAGAMVPWLPLVGQFYS